MSNHTTCPMSRPVYVMSPNGSTHARPYDIVTQNSVIRAAKQDGYEVLLQDPSLTQVPAYLTAAVILPQSTDQVLHTRWRGGGGGCGYRLCCYCHI